MSGSRKPPSASYDVVIVGGGMVGATLACALGDSGLKVAVVERHRPMESMATTYDLRVSALTLASQTVLESVGAWRGIVERRLAPVRGMDVWDGSGRGEIVFDAAEIGEPCLAYIVENSVIVAALHERLQQYTNTHVVTDAVIGLEASELAKVTLASGRVLNTRLVVAADGADSAVRGYLDIPVRKYDMKQQGIVAVVGTERTHDNVARQKFLPTGPLAFLPLPDLQTCSIVWSVDRERADALLVLDDTGFTDALAASFGDRLGAIVSVGPRAAFPLAVMHATRYVVERVALIGDAAHTVHPLAGQGVNLGILDAAALAEVLIAASDDKRDIGALPVLRRYERWRKGENLAMTAVTGGFRYLFGNEWPIVSGLRDAGLSITNRLTPLKRMIMRRAAGLAGDLPRLAQRLATNTGAVR